MTIESAPDAKTAVVYRMVLPDHTCPYGVNAKKLLERLAYAVEEHPLTSRQETDAFKTQHGVSTTPQIFISGERIGGYQDLQQLHGQGSTS